MRKIPLMGAAEIRQRLGGISENRVYQLTRHRDFPAPVAELAMGNVWHRDDVEAWIKQYRPKLDEPTEGDS
jgi:prophage regulatory protein